MRDETSGPVCFGVVADFGFLCDTPGVLEGDGVGVMLSGVVFDGVWCPGEGV